jgi:hypothetical protein
MKVLLRNIATGLLYAGPEQWTQNPESAHDFEMPDRALDAVNEAGLTAVELLMHFDNPSFEIPLNIIGSGR